MGRLVYGLNEVERPQYLIEPAHITVGGIVYVQVEVAEHGDPTTICRDRFEQQCQFFVELLGWRLVSGSIDDDTNERD